MSKRKWHHPEVPADEQVTTSWRSLGEKTESPAFTATLEREFPTSAAQMADEDDAEVSRRAFMKLMGASTALAGVGLVSCRRPVSYIAPYVNAPEWVIPGKPLYYASNVPAAAGATPVMVTTYENRPTKIEPNRLHPDSSGTNSFVQASVLDLYSPARSKFPLVNGEKTDSAAIFQAVKDLAARAAAGKLGILIGADEAPTRSRLLKELQAKFTGLSIYSYEAIADGGAAAASSAIGGNARIVADFEKADRILAVDSDFLGLDAIGPERPFHRRRNTDGADYEKSGTANDGKDMNRLYVAESAFSLTGGMADHRLRIKPSEVLAILGGIAKELDLIIPDAPAVSADHAEWVKQCAADLKASEGRSIVTVGIRQSEAAHRIALAINTALGNIGPGKPLTSYQLDAPQSGDLAAFVADVESGKIDAALIATPSNPVFDAPADLKFADALKALKHSVHLGERADHTAVAANVHVPAAHYLEAWGDVRSINGHYGLVQPVIAPLYGGISLLELLLSLASDDATLLEGAEGQVAALEAVKATFAGISGDASAAAWQNLGSLGFTDAGQSKAVAVSAGAQNESDRTSAAIARVATTEGLEVIFATDHSVLDGRYIDNGWLQEAPDPITKVTWDNAALISPTTAKEIGVYEAIIKLEDARGYSQHEGAGEGEHFKAPVIKLTVNGATIEIPVLISFGQADGVIVLPVGYGQGFDVTMRERDFDKFEAAAHAPNDAVVGDVARNAGFDVYPLRTAATSYVAKGATAEFTGNYYKMALTQEHHAQYGRALAREISTMEDSYKGYDFKKQQKNVKTQGMDSHAPENISLYKPEGSNAWHDKTKPGYAENLLNDNVFQWGMAIDLNSCTGCSACLVACQAENNIPIVGKQQVAMGREMHWIRMDRYFAAKPVYKEDEEGNPTKLKKDENKNYVIDEDNPEMIPQPVGCVQCESAPCETVCPVNATVHTEDGLNAMAYNRCIGTRYCANNCPYKARRFNFFDYNKRNPLLDKNLYKGPLGKKQVGDPKHLQRNPNVTVRMRGVMEKCTYCVQRLKGARIKAKQARVDAIADGSKKSYEVSIAPKDLRAPANSVRVACQDACPSGAITFGNLLNGKAETVVRAKGNDLLSVKQVGGEGFKPESGSLRNYDLLNYIGTRPRTSYLARVKNPNPKMPDAHQVGRATIHMH